VSSAAAVADTDTVYGYVLELDPQVGVRDTPDAQSQLTVEAYPNPFNPSVTVEFTSPRAGYALVTVHDARGAKVATLYDGGVAGARTHAVQWDGAASGGGIVSSGVYFVRVQAGGSVTSRKVVLAK
jgi:hypothetical protein